MPDGLKAKVRTEAEEGRSGGRALGMEITGSGGGAGTETQVLPLIGVNRKTRLRWGGQRETSFSSGQVEFEAFK